MDNITQGVIGGSLYSLITKKTSNKTFLIGSAIANIPDFDVFISGLLYTNPIDQQFFHRGIMHSLIFNVGLSFILGYILYRADRSVSYWRYVLGCLSSIVFGHLLIDGMTSYGMRYFLPRNKTVYSRDNMFVVDFGMRALTISGFVRYLLSKAKRKVAMWIIGIVGLYIASSFITQSYADKTFKTSYPTQTTDEHIQQSLTSVEPLQLLLRRHVIKTDKNFYEGYYSLLDKDKHIDRQTYSIDQVAQEHIQSLAQQPTLFAEYLKLPLNRSRGLYRIVAANSGYDIQNFAMGGLNGRTTGSSRMFGFSIIGGLGTEQLTGTRGGSRSINNDTRKQFRARVFGHKNSN